ncbi:hypothetical protein FOH38_23565 [Lysinibacillus fusiformis]|nr:hypothetical protein FOH38_23565 [Lysinibacillus fusiformis]
MDVVKKIELEIALQKACIEDLLVAVGVHNKRGEYHLAAECGRKIKQAANTIARLEAHVLDHKNFEWLIQDLARRGILTKAVKRYVQV